MRQAIGERYSIHGAGWRATWSKTEPGIVTDWEAVARELDNALRLTATSVITTANNPSVYQARASLDALSDFVKGMPDLPAVMRRFSKTKAGSRRFLFTPPKNP